MLNEFPNDNENASHEDELYNDALVEAYKSLYLKWIEGSQVIKKKRERIESLIPVKIRRMLIITELKQEVRRLNFELEKLNKFVRILNFKADKLDGILSM